MFPRLKKQLKRRIVNRFSRKYNCLPQLANGNKRRFKFTWCRRLLRRTFNELLFIVLLIALVVIVILRSNGVTMSDVKYHVGLGPSAILSLSTLDQQEDVNFPEDNLYYDKSLPHMKRGDIVIWKVNGFNQYIGQIENNSDVLGIFGKLPSGKKVDGKGSGFWIFRNVHPSQGDVDNKTGYLPPSIRAFRVAEHVLAKYSREEIEVAVAVRSYVDGEAELLVKYEDISGRHFHTDRFEQKRFRNKGFCYLILDVPFDKRINTVYT